MKFYNIQFCLTEELATREPDWYTVAVTIDEIEAEKRLPFYRIRHTGCPVRIKVADELPWGWMPTKTRTGYTFYYIDEDAFDRMPMDKQIEWLNKWNEAKEQLKPE